MPTEIINSCQGIVHFTSQERSRVISERLIASGQQQEALVQEATITSTASANVDLLASNTT